MVIEVISPANRKSDLNRLLKDYSDFQIPEVLLIFPETRTYESYQRISLPQSAQSGKVSTQTIPEISIDLDRLWEEF